MEIVREDKVKSMLIKKVAIKTLQSESIVEAVINSQFKNAFAQTKIVHDIDFTGLGKFMISQRKVKIYLEKNERKLKKVDNQTTIADCTKKIEYLKTKIK